METMINMEINKTMVWFCCSADDFEEWISICQILYNELQRIVAMKGRILS